MCLAIPAQVALVGENHMAQVEIGGITRTVSLDLVPEAGTGDWVLVHAGYAIQIVDEQFAAESWDLIKQLIAAGDELAAAELGIDPADAAAAGPAFPGAAAGRA